METVDGCTVIPPSKAGEPVHFGPAEMEGSYVVLMGSFPPGEPGPPLHVHPHTDEAFYLADGQATFLLGDREVPVTAGGLAFALCNGDIPT
jgi:mannose-6-phosphate isomerase-like protein (cupin superfamily)